MKRLVVGFTVAIALLLPASPVFANVSVGVCNQTCICIYWDSGGSSTVEIRCIDDAGWSSGLPAPSPVPGDGSWGNGGTSPWETAPGAVLPASISLPVSQANTKAKNKVQGTRQYDEEGKSYFTPTNCTRLFYGSPFSKTGYDLLNEYIKYRYGKDVPDPQNPDRIPCNEGFSAWTVCCTHEPYVMICDSFLNMTTDDRAAKLIHEAMHVSGQLETIGGTNGGQTPPDTSQITQAVKAACGLQ